MTVLLGAIVPYALATLVLLLVWRHLYRKHPYPRLAVIYVAAFALWHLSNVLLIGWQPGWPCGVEAWLATAFLYALSVDFTLANYTCIEGETPSMILFTLLDDAGNTGCSRQAIMRGFRELGHVEDRLDTMEAQGLVRRRADGSLSATRVARAIRWGFDACFRPLGREGPGSCARHEEGNGLTRAGDENG